MGAQTNELLNIYMSFAMGENPLTGKATMTIEQQGHGRHQARGGQVRQQKMMEVMWNAKGLQQERVRQDLERDLEPIAWIGSGGGGGSSNSRRSFEDELKRFLRR